MNPAWQTLKDLGLTRGEDGSSPRAVSVALEVIAEDLDLLADAATAGDDAEHLVGAILRMSHRAKLLAELAREKAEATA